MRVEALSSISAVCPSTGFTASSDNADPVQLTVIDPPVEEYVVVDGAGPCVAIVLEVELDDELDDADCSPIEGGGCDSTVDADIVDSTVSGTVVIGAAGVVETSGTDT